MSTANRQGRKVYIPGVPRVTWATGRMSEFAAGLVSALESMGELVPYDHVMGASGVAFRFTLAPGQWNPGNYATRGVSHDPDEPIRRAFRAVGRRPMIRARGTKEEDTALILDSIERGVPVLASGVCGPSDFSLICGCDDGGEVLLGWSTYQDIPDDHNIPHDPLGYFRKPGWHDCTDGYVFIGDKVERPPARDVYLGALEWALDLVRQPRFEGRCFGLDAYRVWADEMEADANFPPGDDQILSWRYLSTLCNLMMIDDRRSAPPFVRDAANALPECAKELCAAADCYEETCRLRESMKDLIKEDFSADARNRLADPTVRREYVGRILRIRDSDAEAAEHIGRGVAGLKRQ